MYDILQQCPSIHPICVDLSDWNATQQTVNAIGSIDLLVNCAGIAVLQSFLDVEPDAFDK